VPAPTRRVPGVVPAGTRLCHAQDIGEGQARGFLPAPDSPRKVIVVRWKGHLYGWLDRCPHYIQGTPMAWRRDGYLNGTGTHLACHAHGAWFEIETGQCVRGPCLGRPLTAVPLVQTESGDVVLAADLEQSATPRKSEFSANHGRESHHLNREET